MSSVIHRRSDCRACGSRDLELVLSLKPSPIGDAFVTAERVHVPQPSYPIDLHMCQECGLAQLLDVIDPGVLYGDYIYVTASSLGLAEHFRGYADNVIEKCKLAPGNLVVDIGSNDGTLLGRFQEQGMTVLGIEPASHIAAAATASGIKTIDMFFTPALAKRMVAEHGHAKVVTANNVLANIDDLLSLVQAVDEVLDRDGVFVFESSFLVDLLENLVFDFIYHEHLSSFSVRPIEALFRRVGMELAAVQRVSTKGGSLRYFLQRPHGPLTLDRSVEQMRTLEDGVGLYRRSTFEAFSARIEELKSKTNRFLTEAKLQGKKIAGFGASITGTTLIYHFEIGGFLDYLVDDNFAKQGRFSPGHHLPVLPSSALQERRPDYVVVLAWRYAEAFIRKNQQYLERGGCFVVPLPEFQIVTKN